MNSFCMYCVGGKSKNKLKEIQYCNDKYCPFYRFRYADLDDEDEKEVAQKLLGECGIINEKGNNNNS